MSARGLGKGLEAIIPGWVDTIDNNKNVLDIEIEKIRTGVYQPRKNFDETKLQELSESIRQKGIIQPLVVVKADDDMYNLIAGERRLRAAKMAGLDRVPIIVKNYAEDERLEIALIENLQREDLNAVEESETYSLLIEKYSLKQDELAHRLQKSRSYITNSLRLLTLSDTIKNFIREGKIASTKARTLLSIDNKDLREKISLEIIEKDLSVREIESKIERLKNLKIETKTTKNETNPDLLKNINILKKEFKEKFSENKNISLNIKSEDNQIKGEIKMKFESEEELKEMLVIGFLK